LGINIVIQLIDAGLVKDMADLFTLQKGQLLALEGFAEKKAENLLTSLEQAKGRSLSRLLSALGIRGVGEVMASDLAHHYFDLEALSRATAQELQEIEGVGPNIAEAIVDWFAKPANQNLLEKLKAAGVWPTAQLSVNSEQSTGSLAGMSFVVTGTLAEFTRDEIKEFIQSNGGKVIGSVSKNTDYLVLGENPGSKFEKAKSLNIKIINENELKKLAG